MVINTTEVPRPVEHTYGSRGLDPSSPADLDRVINEQPEAANPSAATATDLRLATGAVLQVLRGRR